MVRRGTIRGAVRAVVTGAGVGAVLFALYFALNAWSLTRSTPAMLAHVRLAYAQGQLDGDDYKRGDTTLGEHQFNDCLILAMATDDRASLADRRISPSHPFADMNRGVCAQLEAVSERGAAGLPIVFYHNYIHGHTMLARLMLPDFRVDQIRAFYKALLSLVVAAGLVAGLWQMARGRAAGAFWALLFLIFARWYGLESFGQSLGHAPADLVTLGYALFLAIASARGGIGPTACVVSAAMLGGGTIIFEFLTGGIPLGFAMLIGGLPLACADPAQVRRSVVASLFSYGSAIATCCAVKLVLVAQTFGWGAIVAVGQRGAQRIAGAPTGEKPLDLGIGLWASRIWEQMTPLASGLYFLTTLMIQIAVVAGIWGFAMLRRAGGESGDLARYLALSNLPLLLWFMALPQHSIVHAWFMTRMLAWTIVTGLALFALAAFRMHGARWAGVATPAHEKAPPERSGEAISQPKEPVA